MDRTLSRRHRAQPLARLRQAPLAIVRRLLPSHPRVGFPWVFLRDGSVTFHESGFVAATSPAMLLARHNWETLYIRRALDNTKARHSLEVGCGYGRLTSTIADYSDHHIGTDINFTALHMARAAYPTSDLFVSSAQRLPVRDHAFDLVCTWTALQHIPPDRIAHTCGEIIRVLRTGGALLSCEETRYPDRSVRRPHTWHRTVAEYARLLAPLRLEYSSYILELDQLPGATSPGRVMLWRV